MTYRGPFVWNGFVYELLAFVTYAPFGFVIGVVVGLSLRP